MKKQEYKSFAELYTNIIKIISDKSQISVDTVLNRISNREEIIKQEYEDKLIMDEQYYIDKFLQY